VTQDPYDEIRRALARQREAGHDNLSSRELDKFTRMTCGSLLIADLAQVLGGVIKAERAELVAHMHRLFQLSLSKAAAHDHDTRVHNLHARLAALESEIRTLKRGAPR
jgi:hypothetical protein